MLSIESGFYIVANIYLVDYLVCILLQRGCEYDDLVVLRHRFDKLNTTWSNQEITLSSKLKNINCSFYLLQHYESTFHPDRGPNSTFYLLEWAQEKVEKLSEDSKNCLEMWQRKHSQSHLPSELRRGSCLLGLFIPKLLMICLFVLIQMCLCCQQIWHRHHIRGLHQLWQKERQSSITSFPLIRSRAVSRHPLGTIRHYKVLRGFDQLALFEFSSTNLKLL